MLRGEKLKETLTHKETIELPRKIITILEKYNDIEKLHDDFTNGLFDEQISHWFSWYFDKVVSIAFEKKNYVPMKPRYYVRLIKGEYGFMNFNKYTKRVKFGHYTPMLFRNEPAVMTQFTKGDIRLLDSAGVIPKEYAYMYEEELVDELEVDYETVFYIPLYDSELQESNLFEIKYKNNSMKYKEER